MCFAPSRGTPTSEPSPRACSTVLPHGAGDLKLARDVDFADEESRRLLCEPTPDGRGRLVLVSHLGVAEATRALAQHDRAVPVWALIFDRHAPRFKAMLEAVAPDASRHVIAVDRLGVETASMLQDAIERGEWVAIAADRTPNDALTRGDPVRHGGLSRP